MMSSNNCGEQKAGVCKVFQPTWEGLPFSLFTPSHWRRWHPEEEGPGHVSRARGQARLLLQACELELQCRTERKGEKRCELDVRMIKNLPAKQETWIRSLGWEDPLEKG